METLAPSRTFNVRAMGWQAIELIDGDDFSGVIVKLPTPRDFNGSRLFLDTSAGVIGIHATAKRGHTLLERALEGFQVGDRIRIVFHGMRTTADGGRSYRHYEVMACD